MPRLPKLTDLAFGAALLGCGCAALTARSPDPGPPVDAGASAARFEGRSLADPGLLKALAAQEEPPSTAVPPPGGWPPELLERAAVYFSPAIQEARAHLAAAESGAVTAGTGPDMGISVTPTYAIGDVTGFSPWTVGGDLDLPLETAGKRDLRLAVANRRIVAARIALRGAKWKVRSRVRAAVVELVFSETQARLAQSEEAARAGVDALLAKRLAVGEASRPEVTSADLALAKARQASLAADGRVRAARLGLAAAIGVPGPAVTGVRLAWPAYDAPQAVEAENRLQATGLESRADVQSALQDALATDADARLAAAKAIPDVHFGPGYQWDEGASKFTLGVSFSLPQQRGPLAEAEARRQASAAAFEAVQEEAIGEIAAAFANYHSTFAEVDQASKSVTIARSQERTTEQRLAAGDADRLDLESARLEVAVALRAYQAALSRAQSALGAMEDAVQAPASALGSPESTGRGPAGGFAASGTRADAQGGSH